MHSHGGCTVEGNAVLISRLCSISVRVMSMARIEIFVRAAILFGEFIIFPFPENRQQGGNAHGKQTVAEDDATRSVFAFYNSVVQHFSELTGMFLPLLSGEGDLCGKIQQMQMHLKQLFSQLAIVGTQIGLVVHRGASFPYPFRFTGVDDETAVKPSSSEMKKRMNCSCVPERLSASRGR